jgi:5-hydroxyisourate hydrolase
MSAITTHVLDIMRGSPASGIAVTLEIHREGENWVRVGAGETDRDGRLKSLWPDELPLAAATYRLTFETSSYFVAQGIEGFYPEVSVVFVVRDTARHYHVPLLLSPYGYSTYRGS